LPWRGEIEVSHFRLGC